MRKLRRHKARLISGEENTLHCICGVVIAEVMRLQLPLQPTVEVLKKKTNTRGNI